MASQYEQGPEAKAVEEGFAIQELFNREQGRNKRAASEQTFNRGMADVTQAHALDRMVKGEDLKEQGAQREAERTAPFLRTLISGNPNVAKTFGFGSNVTTPGELPAPEAGYAGTEAKTAFQPRQPTMAEATGLSRAVPGITQTLLSKSMDPSAGFTLAPGQIRFNAMGQEIARGGPMDVGMSLEEATAVKKRIEEQDPLNVGRVGLASHEKGGWTVSLTSQAPLSPPNPANQRYWDRKKAGMDEKANWNQYVHEGGDKAGYQQLQIQLNTMPGEAVTQSDEKTRISTSAFRRLQDMNNVEPALVREFLTWKGSAADLYGKVARIPGVQYLVGPGGLDQQAFIEKYNTWAADLGRIRESSFDAGGKQLTPFEDSVVTQTRPLKSDAPEVYFAKMKWMEGYTGAQEYYRSWSRMTPRGLQTPEAQQAAWGQALQKAGIKMGNEDDKTDYRRFMTPDDRMRDKLRAK